MSEDVDTGSGTTKRRHLRAGTTVGSGGLLAGRAGERSLESATGETATGTKADSESLAETETQTPEDEPYSVTTSPGGTVEFDSISETVFTCDDGPCPEIPAAEQFDQQQIAATINGEF